MSNTVYLAIFFSLEVYLHNNTQVDKRMVKCYPKAKWTHCIMLIPI